MTRLEVVQKIFKAFGWGREIFIIMSLNTKTNILSILSTFYHQFKFYGISGLLFKHAAAARLTRSKMTQNMKYQDGLDNFLLYLRFMETINY